MQVISTRKALALKRIKDFLMVETKPSHLKQLCTINFNIFFKTANGLYEIEIRKKKAKENPTHNVSNKY